MVQPDRYLPSSVQPCACKVSPHRAKLRVNIPQSPIHLKLDHMASDVQTLKSVRFGGRDWD